MCFFNLITPCLSLVEQHNWTGINSSALMAGKLFYFHFCQDNEILPLLDFLHIAGFNSYLIVFS